MSGDIPALTGPELIKSLKKDGFTLSEPCILVIENFNKIYFKPHPSR